MTAAVSEPVEGKVLAQKFANLKNMVDTLSNEASVQGTSAFDVDAFMESILSGESEDEVWEAQELSSLASKDYTEKPFYLKPDGIKWMRSGITNGFPFYAMLTGIDQESGEEVVVNGGGTSFVSVLYRLEELDAFNAEKHPNGRLLKFVAKPTLTGNTVILLKPVSEPKTVKARAPK